MNSGKIKNFEDEHPGKRFPPFQSLDASETQQIRDALARAFGAQGTRTAIELTTFLDSQACEVDVVNADSDSFQIRNILRQSGISPHAEIFINWYRYDDIDRMKLDDFADRFHEIRYSSADDIDIFDSTFSWIVSVTHSGTVKSLFASLDENGCS